MRRLVWGQAKRVPVEQRVAMLPSVVRMLLATFLEEVAGADGTSHVKKGD